MSKIKEIKKQYLDAIFRASSEEELEVVRLQAIGKKGDITLKMRELGNMKPDERLKIGPQLNALKELRWKKVGLLEKIVRIFLT